MLLMHYPPIKCPSFPPNLEQSHFSANIPVVDEAVKQVYELSGKISRQRIQMSGAGLADGTPQPLYWPPGHEHAGVFKEMAQILTGCGFTAAWNLPAQCPEFRCPPDNNHCCCQHIEEKKTGRTGTPVSSWAQKTLEHSSIHSASIRHTETEREITKAYSNSKYTLGGLKLYSTNKKMETNLRYVF